MTYIQNNTPDIMSAPATHNRTSIIIPCYNEANRLHLEMFLNFARKNPKISFVFVDDGSKDLTINLLCGAMAALPNQVDVLMMARNAGKAEAVRHGLKFAAFTVICIVRLSLWFVRRWGEWRPACRLKIRNAARNCFAIMTI